MHGANPEHGVDLFLPGDSGDAMKGIGSKADMTIHVGADGFELLHELIEVGSALLAEFIPGLLGRDLLGDVVVAEQVHVDGF